ncbi:glycosyltransferase [Nesterenkonia flava]|uniref:Glycosyltransferase n=1 Tax=Nesterenkonia flava TaxID=469799 RepID=A0ABU1FU59_9MICC|nr:glycosyltransferase [Nesterenkonia flava]MDR5711686.1 glycosyltransferase [Nesterenkonia flava]
MHDSPQVSIVMPVFNDEDWITEALESCLSQTMADIEVICVDDASTDSTPEIIERYHQKDPRVRLIRQGENRSAFQARRVGVMAAQAPFVLFLDGDDELAPQAAARAAAKAEETGADLVGFGVAVIGPNGGTVAGYQKRLAHTHTHLEGEDVLRGLFPVSKPAQGQLWRYLFRTEVLRTACSLLPEDLVLSRVNDLPLTYLAAATAQLFVSIPDRLYKYHFRRGGSGHRVDDLAQFQFYARGIESVEALAPAVRKIARRSPDPEPILDGYETIRLSIIGNVLGYLLASASEEHYGEYLAHLYTLVNQSDVVLAAADYAPDALPVLAKHSKRLELTGRSVRNVLLTTKAITTGGVSLVLLAQARYLRDAGFNVTIAAQNRGSVTDQIPAGVNLVEVTGRKSSTRLRNWAEICRSESIDVIIDHQTLYSWTWPSYALMAGAVDVPTIGWVHSFALRPVYDLKHMISFIRDQANCLASLVTLSPLDVSFWKLQGVAHTAYLPNPPSPMLLNSQVAAPAKSAPQGPLKLIWWGRLEEHTKQVSQLIEVAAQLRELDVDFTLRIIGPDSPGLTAADFAARAKSRGVEDVIDVVGPLHGQQLLDAIDAADIFVSTSVLEGYQLTLAEAQSRGLPAAMYELPWLTLVQNNGGIVTAPQGEARALARQIQKLAEDPRRYEQYSAASVEAAQRALSPDFSQLYEQLVTGTLPGEYSPEPTLSDAQRILDWIVFFTERNAGLLRTSRKRRIVPDGQKTLLRRALNRADAVAPGLRPLKRRVKRLIGR